MSRTKVIVYFGQIYISVSAATTFKIKYLSMFDGTHLKCHFGLSSDEEKQDLSSDIAIVH